MLVFKAAQVIGVSLNEPKDWAMEGRTGTTHSAQLAVIGPRANVATIVLKCKTADDLKKKVASFTIGKPAEIELHNVVPVFKHGQKKASSFELEG